MPVAKSSPYHSLQEQRAQTGTLLAVGAVVIGVLLWRASKRKQETQSNAAGPSSSRQAATKNVRLALAFVLHIEHAHLAHGPCKPDPL